MRGISRTHVLAASVAGLLGLAAATAQAVVVTKADDVCSPAANPCLVQSVMDIPVGLCTNNTSQGCTTNTDCTLPGFCKSGSVVLDFGVREVQVSNSGQFNFGVASGSILTGNFTANTTSPAIDANGVDSGGTDSGTVKLYARRKCSVGGSTAPLCVSSNDCKAGTCDRRRCTLLSAKSCTSDASCQVGTCVQSGLRRNCSLDSTVQCATNSDCNLGTCPAQLTCSNRATDPRNCSTNTDCDFGTCTVGSASISLGGSVVGNSEFPAFLDFRAADNISLTKTINLNGTTADSDGGELSMDAAFGSITIAGAVTATSGGFSTGGDVSLYAGTDVTVNSEINVSGGDFDGGTIDFDAGRDVLIARSILGNSGAGAGYGGEFLVVAGRDLSVTGVSAASKTSLETSGNSNVFNEAGDGGAQDYSAERNLTLNVNTRLISNGAAPDALGGDVALDASNVLTFNGDITARGTGANGSGGAVEAFSTGATSVGSTATVDVTGGADDGGEMQFFAGGDLAWGGTADLGASNGGSGGAATLDSDTNATISGTVRITTGNAGDIDVSACYVTVTGTGKLDQGLTEGDNTIEAEEEIRLNTGSLMKTGSLGTNTLVYRTALKPPVTNGTISPAPQLVINTSLKGCVICGNNKLDGGESCEDGNTVNGDGCNSGCQNEACVAQTAAQPSCTTNADCPGVTTCTGPFGNKLCTPWNLCEDGNPCTNDSCNDGQDTCVHTPKSCGDAHACTTDTCDAETGACVNTPNDGACNDGNVCTDDLCSATTGCANTANTDPCNDGVECTTNDTCSNKACVGTPGEGCGFCGDGAKTPPEACDDGNATHTNGEYCGVNCVLIPCGRPTNGNAPRTSDALLALRTAVDAADCSIYVCDVNAQEGVSNGVTAADAQRILRAAVGQDVVLTCPTPP
jgi:cysteine-rich repeat protein